MPKKTPSKTATAPVSSEAAPTTAKTGALSFKKSLDLAIEDPTVFLSNEAAFKNSFLQGSKQLYDRSNVVATSSYQRSFGPFDELLVDGMDCDTIWEQISSRNKPITRFLKKNIQKLKLKEIKSRESKESSDGDEQDNDGENDDFADSIEGNEDNEDNLGEGDEEDDINDDDDEDMDDDDDDDDDEDGGFEDKDSEESFDVNGRDDYEELEKGAGDDEEDDDEEVDDDEDDDVDINGLPDDGYGDDDDDEGDDDFSVDSQMDLGLYDDDDELINLSERKKQKLEEYRKKDEARKNKNKNKANNKSEVDEDEEGDESENDDMNDDDDDGDDDEEDDNINDDDDDDDDDGDDDGDNDDEDEGDSSKPKATNTSFLKRQEILQAQIKEYESNLVKDKSWELKGEVKGVDRPENSLLSVITDVDRASKPAPIITQEYTTSIEDMIKKRINDGRFDDVVKKTQVADAIGASARGSDLPEVSQEKSKLGLGDVYAEQFMKDSASTKKEASAKKEAKEAEVRQLFDKACRELDALCHFFYSPRPVVADLSVKSLPLSSIAMEDPTPAFNSSHNSLAPQEVLDNKSGQRGFSKSEEEMTRDDRKRRRRQKKEANRKKASSEDADSSNNSKRKDREEIKDKRVTVNSGKSDSVSNPVKKFSKSHQFFENLETLKTKK